MGVPCDLVAPCLGYLVADKRVAITSHRNIVVPSVTHVGAYPRDRYREMSQLTKVLDPDYIISRGEVVYNSDAKTAAQ